MTEPTTLQSAARTMLDSTPDKQLASARFAAAVLADPVLIAQLFDRAVIRAAAAKCYMEKRLLRTAA